MQNVLFGVSYLGTSYAGWQRQDNALSIQEVIESAFEQICNKKVEIFASGRTDAGVHAIEQCFNAKINFQPIQKLPLALNSKLPEDIRIMWAKVVDDEFHARFSAHKKTYVYRVRTSEVESPFDSFMTTYLKNNLNYSSMLEAAKLLVGEHDFRSFCSAHTTTNDFVRTIYELKITRTDNLYEFEITGNGFLYNMVRIIVGTLVDVGNGKIKPQQVLEILNKKDRKFAGKTMPAKALTLKKVEY